MSRILTKLNQLEKIDNLIRLKSTGTPIQLAKKIDTSERTVYNLINELRILGASIKFCKFNQSYYYMEEFYLPYKSNR